jgi:hypothetical protein
MQPINRAIFRPVSKLCGSFFLSIVGAIVVGGFAAGDAHAQTKPARLPVAMLSALQVGDFSLPDLYFVHTEMAEGGKVMKEFRPLEPGNGGRGPAVEIVISPPIRIYTGSFNAKNEPEMKPFCDVPAKAPGERLLLVLYLDSQGSLQKAFLDDSKQAHPPGSVRLANFGATRIAFSAGGPPVAVLPGAEGRAMPVPGPDGRFPFKVIEERPGDQPLESPIRLLKLNHPGQRLLVIYASLPVSVPTGETNADGSPKTARILEPVAYRLYDSI